jgi:hypothetical protein
MNEMLPRMSFYFLTGEDADYAGMARLYRRLLKEGGALGGGGTGEDSEGSGSVEAGGAGAGAAGAAGGSDGSDGAGSSTGAGDEAGGSAGAGGIPLRADILGSDVKAGFLANANAIFTTAAQAEDILLALRREGVQNVTMVYKGWQKGGINGARYGQTAFEPKIGGAADFARLSAAVGEAGRFFLNVSPITANEDQISEYWQAATTLSKSYAMLYRENFSLLYRRSYILRPSLAAGFVEATLTAHPGLELSVDEMGSSLYADNTRGGEVTRSQTLQMFDRPDVSAFNTPNAYLWDTADIFLDIPMVNSQYLYESDTVPFLQMALRGSMEYYAPYMNTSAQSPYSLLKALEYGAYPSFILTGADSRELRDTMQEELFSTFYLDWAPAIGELYAKMNGALSLVDGQEITDHKALADGVAVTVFGNGARIYVNYGARECAHEGVAIPAQSFAVRKGE